MAQRSESSEAQGVRALCRTLNATVTNLLYTYAALQEGKDEASRDAVGAVARAIAASQRDELGGMVVKALASAIERVINCSDVALRDRSLKQLRAQFVPARGVDKGTQSDAILAVVRSPSRSPAASPRKLSLVTRLPPVEGAADAPTTPAGMLTEKVLSFTADNKADEDIDKDVDPAKLSFFERQAYFKRQKAKRIEDMKARSRAAEERQSRPSPLAAAVRKTVASEKYSNVESVMKKERLVSKAKWQLQAEEKVAAAERGREEALERAKEEVAKREAAFEQAALSDAARDDALSRYAEARAAQKRAEDRLEEAREEAAMLRAGHAEELEVRDAFGDGGLVASAVHEGFKVVRVQSAENFDSHVGSEYRVKDAESGERGVTLLKGRLFNPKGRPLTEGSEVQAVMFDTRFMTDIQARSRPHHRSSTALLSALASSLYPRNYVPLTPNSPHHAHSLLTHFITPHPTLSLYPSLRLPGGALVGEQQVPLRPRRAAVRLGRGQDARRDRRLQGRADVQGAARRADRGRGGSARRGREAVVLAGAAAHPVAGAARAGRGVVRGLRSDKDVSAAVRCVRDVAGRRVGWATKYNRNRTRGTMRH